MMMRRVFSIMLISALATIVHIPTWSTSGEGVDVSMCKGQFKGRRLSSGDLDEVFKKHTVWFTTYHGTWGLRSEMALRDPRRANLCRADLHHIDLSNAKLMGANLSEADLRGAILRDAYLVLADLRGIQADEAVFAKASLQRADLRGAVLVKAKFHGADLAGVQLSEAHLFDTELDEAILFSADLGGVFYEPKAGSLPLIHFTARAENLSRMTFKNSPHALVELQQAFKKAGLKSQERQITYAIRHTQRVQAWQSGLTGKIESTFNYILFELTTEWGMYPTRALVIMAGLFAFSALAYTAVLRGRGPDGIWRISEAHPIPTLIQADWLTALRLGIWFSLLSAFHIGWQEFNLGNWLARIQPHEYTLRASGWVRMVSGLQSLISLYLLAIWVLTYFGRPFE